MLTKKQILKDLRPLLKLIAHSKDLVVVALVMVVLGIIVVPLPSVILDFLLTISIAISVLILLLSLYMSKPTNFNTFPTLILIITLFRLSLNIATTRMILSKGHEGPSAVSGIIQSFGNFVVGGNYVIGVIVFTILVIINFIVITKGSGRVAEVAARFVLDAMPGKQMAIDADLNAGLIGNDEAKKRRADILEEANFYGAMDGSSKFVKGDAIAGIIITIINIIGGFLIGIFQFDMDAKGSASTFTMLTIGDGLVSQIPALIISTATGIIITRASKLSKENNLNSSFADEIVNQLISDYKALIVVGVIMILFALVPGLPTFSMGFVGLLFTFLAFIVYKLSKGDKFKGILKILNPQEENEEEEQKKVFQNVKSPEEVKEEEEKKLKEILSVEMLELFLGYKLIKIADPNQGGDLMDKIRGLRRKIALDFGFEMPQVRIRDTMDVSLDDKYQVFLKGSLIGEGLIYPDKFLAMDTGAVVDFDNEMDGEQVKEPAFNLDAFWIGVEKKDDAKAFGYTVVDPSTVVSTHIGELVKKNAEDLITRQGTKEIIDRLKDDYPIIVEEASKINIGLVQSVFKRLLHEKIPLKDKITILETVVDMVDLTKDVDLITERVRSKLSRIISSLYVDNNGVLKLMAFDTKSEQKLMENLLDVNGVREFNIGLNDMQILVKTITDEGKKLLEQGISPLVLITDPSIRRSLADIFEKFNVDVVVLSHAEIDQNIKFEVVANINLDELG